MSKAKDNKKDKPLKEPTTNDLLRVLLTYMKGLAEEVQVLREEIKPKTIEAPLPVPKEMKEGVEEQLATPPNKSNFPIPTEYRDIVDSILNKEFGLEMTPLSDQPAVQIAIVVPKQYSNATPDHIKMYGSDKRSKVIKFSEGVNGLRDWADKVAKNLGTEAMTKISIAREQVKV